MNDTSEATSNPIAQAGLLNPTSHRPEEKSGRVGKSKKPKAASITEGVDPTPGPAVRTTKRSAKAGTGGATKNRRPAKARIVGTSDLDPDRSPSATDLATMAVAIKHEIEAGDLLMLQGLERYRRAGELLTQAKGRIGHGGWERFVADHCGFSTETASNYMRIFARWDEVEEMRGPNPQPVTDFTFKEILQKLSRPRKKADQDVRNETTEGIESRQPEIADRSPRGPVVSGDQRSVASPLDRSAHPKRSNGSPAALAAFPTAVDSTRGSDLDEHSSADPIEAGSNELRATGEAPVGVVITEESRRRWGDLFFLVRHCPIRPRLQKLGKAKDFDADVTMWRLLQSLLAEIQARPWLTDSEGLFAGFVVRLANSRSPSEWEECPVCEDTEVSENDGDPCKRCYGLRYLID